MDDATEDRALNALDEVRKELARAIDSNGSFHTAHEGYAVILEELDELKLEVWKKRKNRDIERMRSEAKQVAAMAIRFMVDLCS